MSITKSNQGVIFDLDGVLIDSGLAHRQSWYDLAEKEGYKMSDDFFNNTFGMQNFQILPILAGGELSAERINELSDWKEQRYRDIISDTLTLSSGAKKLINELIDKNFRLAIGSSTPKANIDFIVGKLNISTYFDAFVSMEDVTKGKPAPDTFLMSSKRLSLMPQNCVVIEDSVHGIEAAKAAGMPVVALTTTRLREDLIEANADLIVNGLYELSAEDFVNLLNNRT